MIQFSLEQINRLAPYEVWQHNNDFRFCTDSGIHYTVSFLDDNPIGGCEAYQFIIGKQESLHAAHDAKVRETILVILDNFFQQNLKVLLYICDTHDGREATRNRLFLSWFAEHAQKERFTIRTANAKLEQEVIYAAVIIENRNPLLEAILSDFDLTVRSLTDKPE